MPRELVLDCSVALAWLLPDESTATAERLLQSLDQRCRLWIPALWWYELANALRAAVARRRLSPADADHALELIRGLPLYVDTLLGSEAAQRFDALAREHGLSAYDAAYLELAQRRGVPLATFDAALTTACRRSGVKLVPGR
ncbi:MAG: type II toxin-antitoxin system VapC family toxin [Deltaproteobacteria bacterium]|nr:type II toxin-antitoxin system VapC family toxin [Deltaproteobacteria bacterium]